MIVVDTSAWVELLRATGSAVHHTLRSFVAAQAELAVTEMVVCELLAGARDERHREELAEDLLAYPVLPLGGLAGFEAAARLWYDARRRGVTPRVLADCLVAVPVIEAGATLLHADRDFDLLARMSDLRIEPV